MSRRTSSYCRLQNPPLEQSHRGNADTEAGRHRKGTQDFESSDWAQRQWTAQRVRQPRHSDGAGQSLVGAQTQRSLIHFNIGNDRTPHEVYHAYGYVKKAEAIVNTKLGSQEPNHPNDHVNMGQSSNDNFPTAMHIGAYTMATVKTIPALQRLQKALAKKSQQWDSVVKIGRTHLEDATPLTVGQEWSGYAATLEDAIHDVEHATAGFLYMAMGGTAVGTGLNSPAVTLFKIATRLRGCARAFDVLRTMASLRHLLCWRHLCAFQSGNDACIHTSSRHGLGDGRGRLDRSVCRCDCRAGGSRSPRSGQSARGPHRNG